MSLFRSRRNGLRSLGARVRTKRSAFLVIANHLTRPALRQVQVPVLVMNGDKGLQVAGSENLEAIERALRDGGNSDYSIVELPNLNHLLFRRAKQGR